MGKQNALSDRPRAGGGAAPPCPHRLLGNKHRLYPLAASKQPVAKDRARSPQSGRATGLSVGSAAATGEFPDLDGRLHAIHNSPTARTASVVTKLPSGSAATGDKCPHAVAERM